MASLRIVTVIHMFCCSSCRNVLSHNSVDKEKNRGQGNLHFSKTLCCHFDLSQTFLQMTGALMEARGWRLWRNILIVVVKVYIHDCPPFKKGRKGREDTPRLYQLSVGCRLTCLRTSGCISKCVWQGSVHMRHSDAPNQVFAAKLWHLDLFGRNNRVSVAQTTFFNKSKLFSFFFYEMVLRCNLNPGLLVYLYIPPLLQDHHPLLQWPCIVSISLFTPLCVAAPTKYRISPPWHKCDWEVWRMRLRLAQIRSHIINDTAN